MPAAVEHTNPTPLSHLLIVAVITTTLIQFNLPTCTGSKCDIARWDYPQVNVLSLEKHDPANPAICSFTPCGAYPFVHTCVAIRPSKSFSSPVYGKTVQLAAIQGAAGSYGVATQGASVPFCWGRGVRCRRTSRGWCRLALSRDIGGSCWRVLSSTLATARFIIKVADSMVAVAEATVGPPVAEADGMSWAMAS